jgi:hypothetical protein
MSGNLNDKQRKAIQCIARGMSQRDAGIKAGYSAKTSEQHVSRLLKNVKSKEYLNKLREKVEDGAVMSIQEKREFLALPVRTPVSEIDEDHILCTGITYSGQGDKIIHSVDPIRAIQEDSKLAGHYEAQKLDVKHTGGVMLVPVSESIEDWEKTAAESQANLMKDAINI